MRLCHGDVWGNGGIAPRMLILGSRCGWMVNFTYCPLHQGKIYSAGLQTKVKRKNPTKESKPSHRVHTLVITISELSLRTGLDKSCKIWFKIQRGKCMAILAGPREEIEDKRSAFFIRRRIYLEYYCTGKHGWRKSGHMQETERKNL